MQGSKGPREGSRRQWLKKYEKIEEQQAAAAAAATAATVAAATAVAAATNPVAAAAADPVAAAATNPVKPSGSSSNNPRGHKPSGSSTHLCPGCQQGACHRGATSSTQAWLYFFCSKHACLRHEFLLHLMCHLFCFRWLWWQPHGHWWCPIFRPSSWEHQQRMGVHAKLGCLARQPAEDCQAQASQPRWEG